MHQELDGADEVVIVQKRLALSHKDKVDAVTADFDLLVIEHQQDLADNFPCGEIALNAEQGGHAEFAIHGASGLGG